MSIPNEQMQGLLMIMASIKQGQDEINNKIEQKQAILPIEEAVAAFSGFLEDNRSPNTIRGYKRLLEALRDIYANRNVPDISASELEGFLYIRWGNKKVSTLKQNLTLISSFFKWCSDYCQYNGQPKFVNPCKFINIKGSQPISKPNFISCGDMKAFISTAKTEGHWLAFIILLTTGMRVSELIGDPRGGKPGIKKKDVNGRVLTIHKPKSGRETETAVIPIWVSNRLNAYMKDFRQDDRIISICYATLQGIIRTHSQWVGLKLKPHDLRKWIASWWSRQQEWGMSNYILRHSEAKVDGTTLISNLASRYIAPLTVEEVIRKQDDLLIEEVLNNRS